MNNSASILALVAALLFLPTPAKASSHSRSQKRAIAESTRTSKSTDETDELPPEELSRLSQAKELLGKYYRHSVVRAGEKVTDVDLFIRQWTNRALKGQWNRQSAKVARTILKESHRYNFDPIFLMAVIENESSFVPTARGEDGEIGLMQLRPTTARWIAHKYKLKWRGKSTLSDPVTNIRIGAAYLAFLRDKFDSHGRLYLAAYNMGAKNVARALERSIWPKDYPNRVMQRYIRFYSELKNDLTRKDSETD
ncbi:MAG: lytic transglycosylase domain-containing protein [Bdellovibrionota bacterium]